MHRVSLVLALGTVLAAAACMSATSPDAGRRLVTRADTFTDWCSGWVDQQGVCHDGH
jgi:hypothetical protein